MRPCFGLCESRAKSNRPGFFRSHGLCFTFQHERFLLSFPCLNTFRWVLFHLYMWNPSTPFLAIPSLGLGVRLTRVNRLCNKWLDTVMKCAVRFLCSAQILLTAASLSQLLRMSLAQLKETCPWIPDGVLNVRPLNENKGRGPFGHRSFLDLGLSQQPEPCQFSLRAKPRVWDCGVSSQFGSFGRHI